MISLPDFKEKQILFIKADWGERASIRFLNDNIVFMKGGQAVNKASCHKVFAVFVLGDIAITTGLLKNGLKYGVSFFFLKNNFELYAPFLSSAEGNVSKQFFSMYFSDIKWRRRSPRTKQDIPNFLMDIGYTFLFNFTEGLLKLHGFDSYKGFYHKLFFQRKSLACDIMEPMRHIIDKQILKSYNLKQIKENDFKIEREKYVLPFENSAKYANIFMQAIMDRKEDIFSYIHGFYKFVMCPEKNEFPEFKIKL